MLLEDTSLFGKVIRYNGDKIGVVYAAKTVNRVRIYTGVNLDGTKLSTPRYNEVLASSIRGYYKSLILKSS